MTAKTSENLAQVLHTLGLFELEAMARADMFHDFLSPYDLPELELEARLRAAVLTCPDKAKARRIEAVRQRMMSGEFDASKEESDAWAASEDGQAAYRELLGGKRK